MVLGRASDQHTAFASPEGGRTGLAPDVVILIAGVGDETFMPEPRTFNSQMSETLL